MSAALAKYADAPDLCLNLPLRSAANWVFRGIEDTSVQVRGLKLA